MMIGASRIIDAGVKLAGHCRRIHEWLEPRARLSLGLYDAVVLALSFEVVEAAHQRHDRAVVRIQRHERALGLRNLRELGRPVVLLAHHVDDVAAREDFAGALWLRAEREIRYAPPRPRKSRPFDAREPRSLDVNARLLFGNAR